MIQPFRMTIECLCLSHGREYPWSTKEKDTDVIFKKENTVILPPTIMSFTQILLVELRIELGWNYYLILMYLL